MHRISSYTDFKEMLDGRVKTLHPKIHSGILFNRNKSSHKKQMKINKFKPIDLVIVNFYPFKEIISKTTNKNKIIENIDIGGPSLVRAAAKNYNDVVIVTDKIDYPELIKEIKKYKGKTSLKFREKLAGKAFSLTAFYISVISEWYNQLLTSNFQKEKLFLEKISELRYGENPHQKSSIYLSDIRYDRNNFKQLSGKDLSYNNYNDIFAGLDILFSEKFTFTVIIKHANPCGVASNKNSFKSFLNAKASDPISAFGGLWHVILR